MSATIIFFVIVNFLISWFNAWSVGRGWNESKYAGGFPRFMAWCGATMSASGFTWCYLVLLVLLNSVMPAKYHLPEKYAEGMFRLDYLFIVLPVIGSGIAITIQSWAHFWKERSFTNGAVAGYNTFADIYNIYQAASAIPDSLSFLGDLFSGSKSKDDDDDSKSFLLLIMVALAILAVIGGILTTAIIVRSTAKKVALQEAYRCERAKRARIQEPSTSASW